jgi:hypothetical protein
MKVEETLTVLARMLWVVDNAVVAPLPEVDDRGAVAPFAADAAAARPVIEVLEAVLRPSNRGVQKVGLTLRVWMALLFLAAYRGRATVAEMHAIATGELPRELQWDLGILTCNCPGAICNPASVDNHGRELTERQLYRVSETITKQLDPDAAGISAHDRASRLATLEAVQDAFLQVTLIFPQQGSSLAVDESGIWSWYKGRRKPSDMPDVDPTDEDANARGEKNLFSRRKGLRQDAKPRPAADVVADPVDEDADFFDEIPDEDRPEAAHPPAERADSRADADDAANDEPAAGEEGNSRPKRICSFSHWGVKTHKNGKRSSYFGYALHALIRVPDVKGGKSNTADEPLLIQQFALTAASTDVVDVTITLVKKIIAAGGVVQDLIGDRHYSYKKFIRWALPLWKLGVKPVLDLRKNEALLLFPWA